MSIPFEHREEACYRFISSGFKLEETTAWMLKEYADNPTITRSKYPEKLCANTVTMGGNGDQQQLNIAAFGNAYRRYASEAEAQLAEASKAEAAKALNERELLRERLDTANQELREANTSIQRHLATINRLDRENTIYQLKSGAEVPEEEVPVVAS